jgi:hypothetical protein
MMTQAEKPAIQELTLEDLRQAAGGVVKVPGTHKVADITLKRGTF